MSTLQNKSISKMGRKDRGIIGFDKSEAIVGYLKDGNLDALIAQVPYQIGCQSIVTTDKVLKGKKVELIQNIYGALIAKDILNIRLFKNAYFH